MRDDKDQLIFDLSEVPARTFRNRTALEEAKKEIRLLFTDCPAYRIQIEIDEIFQKLESKIK